MNCDPEGKDERRHRRKSGRRLSAAGTRVRGMTGCRTEPRRLSLEVRGAHGACRAGVRQVYLYMASVMTAWVASGWDLPAGAVAAPLADPRTPIMSTEDAMYTM